MGLRDELGPFPSSAIEEELADLAYRYWRIADEAIKRLEAGEEQEPFRQLGSEK